MTQKILKTVTPIDGTVLVERPLSDDAAIIAAVDNAQMAQQAWAATPIEERQKILSKSVDAFVAKKSEIAEELTRQMGRPISQSPGEVAGFEERARHMIAAAPAALADIEPEPKEGLLRFICRDPLGVVAVLAPWNYPYLTAVNSIVPALMAGNSVVLKHSSQTPLCAERFAAAFAAGGLPEDVFQFLHMSHAGTETLLTQEAVQFVSFTGSVPGGHSVQESLAKRFIGAGLELGGKDPAYVRADADLDFAVENLVDGAFFNAGQSCCGIERIYVHADLYERFVDGMVAQVEKYRLGDPMDAATTMGPMVRTSAADFVRGQIQEAVAAGARALIDESKFPAAKEGSPYVAPQVLVDVDHSMRIMSEESFGPVVGVMKVDSDEQAVELMNDSEFGLTASIWTRDVDAALELGGRVETGTWFMNRCDYLDPALAWTGVKDSGRGCTLSAVGYEQLTRPKSYHLRLPTG